jgi:hypothetical protein
MFFFCFVLGGVSKFNSLIGLNCFFIMYYFNRDIRTHKLVFEEEVLPDGTEVGYYCQGKVVLL